MRVRRVLCIAGILGLVCAPLVARADDAPIEGVPGSVRPAKSASVRLESEAVQIIVYDRVAECRADFRLVNTGPRTTLRLAFPSVMPSAVGDDPWSPDNFDSFFDLWPTAYDVRQYPPSTLGAFHAWQDGRPLAVKVVQGRDGPLGAWFYEHRVVVPSGATTVTVGYLFSTDHWNGGYGDPPSVPRAPFRWIGMLGSYRSVDYILHTGALWKGTIGTAVIRVTFDDSCQRWGEDELAADPAVTTPGWTRPDARTFQWVFRDFEPTQDELSGTSPYDIRLAYAAPDWAPVDYYEQYETELAREDGDEDFEPTSRWQGFWRPPLVADVDQAESARDMGEYEFSPFGETWSPLWASPYAAWAVKGNGTKTWFAAILGGSRRIRELRIVPGLADADYRKYSRPRTLVATFSDGSKKTLHLADDPRMQRFAVDVETSRVRFRVSAVYRGTKDPDVIAVAFADVGESRSPKWLKFADALKGADE